MPPSPPVLRAGQLIGGRYRVQLLLGRGGMGVVYGGVHELTQRRVALKLVDSEGADLPALRDRFLSEARTAAAVRHPNVVDVLDMGMHGDSPYLVMELLEGRSLDAVLEQKQPLSFEQALAWLFPVMGALVTLHEAGIVHRDIKPSNIFLSQSGRQTIVPKLLDFGLARATSDARLTRSGVVIGTPLYMAPEHAAGAQVGPQADVWSMGVVLYECIAGAMPYTSSDRSVLATQVLAGHVRSLRQVRGDVPPLLSAAIDGALQRELGTRHPSMRAFAQALTGAALASQIAIPDNPDALGLPDFPSWKASSGGPPSATALGTTLELPGSAPRAPSAAPTLRGRRWHVLAYLVLLSAALAAGAWLYRSARAPGTPTAAPPPKSLPQLRQSRPAPPRTAAAAAPPIPALIDAQTPPATRMEEGPAAGGRKMPAEPRPKPQTRRTPPTRPIERPAEVETEWK